MSILAPWVGLEPTTCPLTAGDSTIELPGNVNEQVDDLGVGSKFEFD